MNDMYMEDTILNFLNYGYYIISPVSKSEYISLDCEQILTVSSCISNPHPLLDGSFWMNHDQDQKVYQKLLAISDNEFAELMQVVDDLYNSCRLDGDSRFLRFEDAKLFYKKYLYNMSGMRIIGIAIEDNIRKELEEEIEGWVNAASSFELQSIGDLIGYDILGWDYGGFHTYLCNSLDKEISKSYSLEVNSLGVIQNSYQQVKEFAKMIDGKGEPVLWLPFAVYDCTF